MNYLEQITTGDASSPLAGKIPPPGESPVACSNYDRTKAKCYKLVDGKFHDVTKTFRLLKINELLLRPYVVVCDGLAYCGGQQIWNKYEGKNRAWLHDLILDIITEEDIDGPWLNRLAGDYI